MTVSVIKHISQKLFTFCKVVIAISLLTLLPACGDDTEEPYVDPRCEWGGVSIDEPTYKDTYTASSDSLRLGGTAPLASDYVTGSSDPGVTVTWYNKATGNSGTAISLAWCGTTFLGTFCNHEWSTDIPLMKGDNHIEVSAHENGELVGRDCITVTYAPYEPSVLPLWIDSFGTSSRDEMGFSIAVDANGNSYITGYTDGNLIGDLTAWDNNDSFIAKYDTTGNQLWIKQFGTSAYYDVAYGIAVDVNGNSFITGYWDGQIFIAKYDTSGNQLWIKQLGTYGSNVGYGISVDSAGNIYVTGETSEDLAGTGNAGGLDVFIAKYDNSGNQLWIKQYGTSIYDEISGTWSNDEIGYGISVDANGNSYITGYTEEHLSIGAARHYDVFITKYDTSGNQLWIKELVTSGDDEGRGIAVDANGNSYITGYTEGNLAGTGNAGGEGYDVFIAKVDTDGNQVWIRQYGTSNADKGYGIAVDANGNSYITGYWSDFDVFIMALSP